MCFAIYQKTNPKLRIAKKDIVCYKLVFLGKNDNTFIPEYAYTEGFRYKLKKIAYAKNMKGKRIKKFLVAKHKSRYEDYKFEVDEGIHSYMLPFESYGEGEIVLKCIIPKGTEYLRNDTEYVSLKLKPIEIYSRGTR
jgi:hypothetical protein